MFEGARPDRGSTAGEGGEAALQRGHLNAAQCSGAFAGKAAGEFGGPDNGEGTGGLMVDEPPGSELAPAGRMDDG